MLTRREFLALSAGMLTLLTGCIGSEPEPNRSEGPDVRTQPVQMRLTIPESYLAFTGNTADGAARDYADYSDGNIATSVLEDGSLELYVTDHWYGRLRTMWEDQLGKSLDSLGASEAVVSVEVSDGRDAVAVTARPSFADHADTDLYQLVAACGFLQLLDPESDWQDSGFSSFLFIRERKSAETFGNVSSRISTGACQNGNTSDRVPADSRRPELHAVFPGAVSGSSPGCLAIAGDYNVSADTKGETDCHRY